MPVGRFDGSSDIRPARRVQALVDSDDLLEWANPVRILTPDERDDEMASERIEEALADGGLVQDCREDRRCEYYTMPIIPYEDFYIGMLLVFDASYEFHRIGKNNQAGPGHTQLVASRDLLNWRRLGDRRPFISRGAPGEFDWAMAWYTSLPIVKDGTLWFFYTGNCTTHAGTRDEAYWNDLLAKVKSGELPGIGSIGLATLRRDGFVSLDAGNEGGEVLTKSFRWPGGVLHVNADADGGELRVQACMPDGTPYQGYEQSDAVTGDCLDREIGWPGREKTVTGPLHTHGTAEETGQNDDSDGFDVLSAGKPVRLRFLLRNASLYSYWFSQEA
jgi:hypothetical protein